MRMFLLSTDEDTLVGMRLCGVEGKMINTSDDFESAVKTCLETPDIGILLITKEISERFPEAVMSLKSNNNIIVTQIPDMKNPVADGSSITKYVKDVVGISV